MTNIRSLVARLLALKPRNRDVVGPYVWDLVTRKSNAVDLLELTCSCQSVPRQMHLTNKGKTCHVFNAGAASWTGHRPSECVSLRGMYEDALADERGANHHA